MYKIIDIKYNCYVGGQEEEEEGMGEGEREKKKKGRVHSDYHYVIM